MNRPSALTLIIALLVAGACTNGGANRDQSPAAARPAILVAAGDIAACDSLGDEATAALVEEVVAVRPDAIVALLGDTVYEVGSPQEFASCYEPSWGRYRAITKPAPGDHDYATRDGSGYHGYFGASAGEPRRGWYSYDVGSWHVVVLNSNCSIVGCKEDTDQYRWLQEDLASHAGRCILAYWHHPPFTSGNSYKVLEGVPESTAEINKLFSVLYGATADIVLTGHEHNYERFAPLAPDGTVDLNQGIRSFVVGTGGRSHHPFGPPVPGSEVRSADTFGVLVLTLDDGRYDWEFRPVKGKTFSDRGSGFCH